MSRWFRWHDGTTEDGKFRVVARVSRVTVRDVIALWAFMLEDAAHLEHRGVCKRNEDFMASILDFEDGVVESILEAMENVGMISIGHGEISICNWGKRQFEGDTDPTAAERQRRKRERDKLVSNAPVTRDSRPPETETETDTELNNKQSSTGLAPATALDWTDLEAKLRKAAGWENEPHPGLCVIGPIVGLIEGGASLDLDILPVIASRAAKLKAKSWAYFVGPVQDAMAARLGAAIPQSRAPPDSEFRRKNAAAELQRLSEETGWKPGTKATASTPVIS